MHDCVQRVPLLKRVEERDDFEDSRRIFKNSNQRYVRVAQIDVVRNDCYQIKNCVKREKEPELVWANYKLADKL